MSQHDYVIDNASGASARADINNLALAVASQNSGASAPSTTYAYQIWVDTANGVVKQRNAANSGWLVKSTIDETFVLGRSSNTILGLSDIGKAIVATAGFTQTFTAAATLGDGWRVAYRVESGATVIFDPNSSETIDGATTKTIVGPTSGFISCNGSAFFTIGFSASARPTRQVFTSGSGTYTTPANVTRIKIRMVGGGGGGGGAANAGGGTGGTGGSTTFSTYTAAGGVGGVGGASGSIGSGGAGGASSGSPNFGVTGGSGASPYGSGTPVDGPGGAGGAAAFGGAGNPVRTAAGGDGKTNTGAGGAGGGSSSGSVFFPGGGGGAGAYIETAITSPAATYSYAVGAAGTAGTGAYAGGAGGSGVVIVDEDYT